MHSIRRAFPLVAAVLLAGACSSSSNNNSSDASGGSGGRGGNGGGTGGAAGGSGGSGGGQATDAAALVDGLAPDSTMSMSLTSSALAPGATFAVNNTCAGTDVSPPLAWTNAPAGAMSFAVALVDLDFMDVVHWVIWDLPASTTMLPADLPGAATLTTPVMAKQAHKTAFFGTTDAAFHGPCPSGALHHYLFQVNALDVATLPGVNLTDTTESIEAVIAQHSIGHGDLIGLSNATKPTDGGGGQ